MARSQRQNDIDNYDGTQVPGYYQRTNVEDMINNFVIAYTGDGKVLPTVPRHEIAYWMQRAVQEYSYDVLHSEKSMELELNEAKTVLLPPDYVRYKKITRVDDNGNQIYVPPAITTQAARPVVQDENYDPIYDENGDIIYAQESEAIKRYREHQYNDGREIIDRYNEGYGDFDFYGDDYYYNKRYGLQTTLANQTPFNYLIDNETGVIYFGVGFRQDDIITLFYISDGLADNNDLSKVYVPKLVEDAIYAETIYGLAKVRPALSGAIGLYKQEAKAKRNNAKIRLMNLKSEEMINVMRGKSKWIKH